VRRGGPPASTTYEQREELRRRATAAVQTRDRPRPPEREREPEPARRGNGLRVTELDVPEFMPHR
jgi:hypothetical protein